ncbi:MAG: class I SAM-dependent methyltransferase [Actinocatenispora sp.]
MMTTLDAAAWQESWDRQQEAYLPDREERFTVLADLVDAVAPADRPVRVLDLAGGPGSISLRVLRRRPDAAVTLLDLDPVLLEIARATHADRVEVVATSLADPRWLEALPHRSFDAVLTATALHWLLPDRLRELYAEIRSVLVDGGVLANADHMPDDGLARLSDRLMDQATRRREARHAAGAALSWEAWWERVAVDPGLGGLYEERRAAFIDRHHGDHTPPASWHLAALRDAGFSDVGTVWRAGADATVCAMR